MKHLLHQLLHHTPLTAEQSESAFASIMDGLADPFQTASLLTLLALREPTADELFGAALVMRRHVVAIDAPDNVIDTCGTGGVHSHFFNISTAAAIVAAACGVPVAKHGNRSFTSRSGSSDVLRALGVNIDTTPEQQAACLREANICFAFAPKHHPAMKHAAAIRQALGFSTLFNLLGPLTNPAGARRQVIGTRSPELANKILDVLIRLGVDRALVLSGTDSHAGPLCEISITGATHIAQFDAVTGTTHYSISPADLHLPSYDNSDSLSITSAEESARLIQSLFDGNVTHLAARHIVIANSAAALWVGGAVDTLPEGTKRATAAIDFGAARATLETLIASSHTLP